MPEVNEAMIEAGLHAADPGGVSMLDRVNKLVLIYTAMRALDPREAQLRAMMPALRAIAEGYPTHGEEDRCIVVENPDFQPDNGSDPCLVIDLAALSNEGNG